jgi:hypothetical protein
VTSVRVDVPLPSSATTFDEMVRPSVADVNGSDISGVIVTPNLMRVLVKFSPPVRNPSRTVAPKKASPQNK